MPDLREMTNNQLCDEMGSVMEDVNFLVSFGADFEDAHTLLDLDDYYDALIAEQDRREYIASKGY